MESMELERYYLSARLGEMPWWERRRWVRTVQREMMTAVAAGDMTVDDLLNRLDTELLFQANPVVGLLTVRRLLSAMPEVGRSYRRRWQWLFLPHVSGWRRLSKLTTTQRNTIGNYPELVEIVRRMDASYADRDSCG